MEIIGIVVEFNPFHLGHEHLVNEIRKLHSPDLIVVVMSSSFVQRGEPAVFDKWTRAEMALEMGVDVVLELPFLFACQNAEIFARGAIKTLAAFGITSLAFGAENDNIGDLTRLAKAFSLKSNPIDESIKKYLKFGNSYIYSKNKTLLDLGIIDDEDVAKISKANNILAIEYLKAIDEYNSSIRPLPIPRIGVDHDSIKISNSITSATNIRNFIYDKIDVFDFVPSKLQKFYNNFTIPDHNQLYNILKFHLLENNYRNILNTMEYEIGLENRIAKYIDKAKNIEELATLVSTKRITKARLRRIIVNSLMRIDKIDVKSALLNDAYLRILGFNDIGSSYLRNFSGNKITNFKEISKKYPHLKNIEKVEARATDLYSIITNNVQKRDYLEKPKIK